MTKLALLLVLLIVMVIALITKATQDRLSPGAQCQEWAAHHNWKAFDAHDC